MTSPRSAEFSWGLLIPDQYWLSLDSLQLVCATVAISGVAKINSSMHSGG